jgi:hypothetical protein
VFLSSPDHIALITHGLFNVSIPQNQLPKNWKYKEEEGHWVDAEHNAIEGDVEFEVTQYDAKFATGRLMGRLITTGSILSMLGSLKHSRHLSS